VLSGHASPVTVIEWSPDDKLLLSAGSPGNYPGAPPGERAVKLWDVEVMSCNAMMYM
jgi:WD40 repeat protein